MLDNLTIEIELENLYEQFKCKHEPFVYANCMFNPHYKNGSIVYWFTSVKNLRLQVYFNTLKITNSIHKYFKENNHSDFYLAELYKAFEKLSKHLEVDLFKAEVKKFEIGCNVRFERMKPFFEGIKSYNGNDFSPMFTKRNKEYGKKLFATEYNIKFYNKTIQVKELEKKFIEDYLMRFEFEVKRMKFIQRQGIAIYLVKDFFDNSNLSKIIALIMKVYDKINKYNVPDLEKLSVPELNNYGVLNDHRLTKELRKKSQRTYFRYKEKLSHKIDNSLYNEAGTIIKEKFNQLSVLNL